MVFSPLSHVNLTFSVKGVSVVPPKVLKVEARVGILSNTDSNGSEMIVIQKKVSDALFWAAVVHSFLV
jgi:hypothetical protein